MKLGVFTPLFNNLNFDEMIEKVASYGLETVEIGTGGSPGNAHLDIDKLLASGDSRKEYLIQISIFGVEVMNCPGFA